MIERRHLIQALTLGLSAASAALASQANGMEQAPKSQLQASGDPGREAKKALVSAYIRACDEGDMAKIDALLAPDAQWWILARQTFDRKTIMQINQKRFPPDARRRSQILGWTIQGDRVAVEYETAAPADGAVGYSIFHHLFIVRGGVIASCREFMNPYPAKPFAQSQAAIFTRVPTRPQDLVAAVETQTREVVSAFVGPTKLDPKLRTPDFTWWLTGVGAHDLDKYLANLIGLIKARPPGSPLVRDDTRVAAMTVDGNRAAVEVARNAIYADHDYLTSFHLLFILRDGKIADMHEHMDVQAAIRGGLPVLEAIAMG